MMAWLGENVQDFGVLGGLERRNAVFRARYQVDDGFRANHKRRVAESQKRRAVGKRLAKEENLDKIVANYLEHLGDLERRGVLG